MKAIMGFGFFLLFLAGIALVMLQGREMARQNMPAGGASLTGVQWQPVTVAGVDVEQTSGMVLEIAEDGSISGNGGCNNFFGSLQTTDEGIDVGQMGATRMACDPAVMDRETRFMQAVQDAATFSFAGGNLQLFDAQNELLVEFVPLVEN